MDFQPRDVRAFKSTFDSLTYDPDAKRSLHLQAGGFVWSDETPNLCPKAEHAVPLTRFMIALISYRMTLTRGEPHAPFTPYWQEFENCCPTWPGFRSERCDPKLIPDIDRELDAEWTKLERMFKLCQRKRERQGKEVTDTIERGDAETQPAAPAPDG